MVQCQNYIVTGEPYLLLYNSMGEKLICNNKKAYHDYFIEEKFEAGMVLTGTEVKSLRMGRANLNDSFAQVRSGEAWLNNLHISPYEFGNRSNHDMDRARKLLLHKKGSSHKAVQSSWHG